MEALGLSSAGYTQYLHRCTEDMRTTDKYRAEVAAEYYRRLKGFYGVELADEMVADAKHFVKFLYSLPAKTCARMENISLARTVIANLFADGAIMFQARQREPAYRGVSPAWNICSGRYSYVRMTPEPRVSGIDYTRAYEIAEEVSQSLTDFLSARAEYVRAMKDVLVLIGNHNSNHEGDDSRRVRKQTIALVEQVVSFAIHPFSVIESTPLDKYYAGLDCMSRQFAGKISTAHKSPVISKRVAKKIGSHVLWLLKAIGKDKHPLVAECVSIFATFWQKALATANSIHMVDGNSIITTYEDTTTQSCMCKNGQNALALYAANKDKVKQLVRFSSDGSVHKRMMIFDAGLRTHDDRVVWCLDREYGDGNRETLNITDSQTSKEVMDIYVSGEYLTSSYTQTYIVLHCGRAEHIVAIKAHNTDSNIFSNDKVYVSLKMPLEDTEYIPYMDTWARFQSLRKDEIVNLYHLNSRSNKVLYLSISQNTNTNSLNVTHWLSGPDDDYDDDDDDDHEGQVWSDRYGEYIDENYAMYVEDYGWVSQDDGDFVYCNDCEEHRHIDDTFYCSGCGRTYSDIDRYNACIISNDTICDDCRIFIYYWDGRDVEEGYASEDHASRAACFSAGDEEHMAAFIEYLGGDPDEPLYVSRYDRTKFMDEYAAFIEDYVESEQEEACEMLA